MTALRKLVQDKLNPDKTEKQANQISSKQQYQLGTTTDHHIGVLEPKTYTEINQPVAYMLLTGDGLERPSSDKVAVFLASIPQNEDGEYSIQEPEKLNEEAILPHISATEFEYAEKLQDYFNIPEHQQTRTEN